MAITVTTDPFGERRQCCSRARLNVLGADVTLESTDRALLDIALEAFDNLPRYRLDEPTCRLNVRLVLTDHGETWPRDAEPPRPVLSAGNGLLCATVDAGNCVVVDPAMSRALVCVSKALLRHRYHARYELIELAILTLASRAQSLVPLHAASIGANGAGLLLMGASGAGKSTLSLHALTRGMCFVSEDSAFVAPVSLLIAGTPNYLHVEPSAIEHVDDAELEQRMRCSPMIRRRSGTQKLEVDLRGAPGRIASTPLRLAAIVFLSRRRASRQPALQLLAQASALNRLRREQAYAMGLPNWKNFECRVAGLPAFELRRTAHPTMAVEELRDLLDRSTGIS